MLDYFTSSRILRGIPYGKNDRNYLDIYLPDDELGLRKGARRGSEKSDEPLKGNPVVILVSGGAWIIGYKSWSALLGISLRRLGIVCVTPDYRNFPMVRY